MLLHQKCLQWFDVPHMGGPEGGKNRPNSFPGQMLYKTTKLGFCLFMSTGILCHSIFGFIGV